MAKILQASDFCLGRHFSGIGKSGDFVRRALKDSLENAVTLALDRSVDLFLVSGNLFAGNMVSLHLVEFAFQQVERLGKIPFIALPGIRDCLDENSIYRILPSENRPENFRFLNSRQEPYLSFPESEVTVYGMTCYGESANGAGMSPPVRADLPGIHIVAMNGPTPENVQNGDAEIGATIDALIRAGFDYVAVGGLDYRRWKEQAYCSGSPETQEFESGESGQVLLIDLSAGQTQVEKIPMGQLVWKQLELDNTRFRYGIELEEEMLKHASPQTLLQIRFNGEFMPDGYIDLATMENEFREKFCCLRIDESRNYENGRIRAGGTGGDTLLTDYAYLVEDAIEKSTPELRPRYLQALATGNAMLSGKDVIS